MHADVPAHRLHQLVHDRQAQPAAAKAPVGGVIRLAKRLKDVGQRGRSNAHPGIADADAQVFILRAALDVQQDLALGRELHRVAQQVEQQLAQAGRVPMAPYHHLGLHDTRQLQPFGARCQRRGRQRCLNAVQQMKVFSQQLQLADLDARQVQNALDQLQQVGAALLNRLHHLHLRLHVTPTWPKQLRRPDHRVQRCAQFMAHIGQKSSLGH